jgi:hypothetical protein
VKKTISGFDKKNERGEKRVDFGLLWSVLDMNNDYKRVFVNLSVMTNMIIVKLRLKPDFNYLNLYFFAIFGNKKILKKKRVFCNTLIKNEPKSW